MAAGVLLWRRWIGRPVLVGHRVEGWLAPGLGRRGLRRRGSRGAPRSSSRGGGPPSRFGLRWAG
jgi:hypothetical protein